MPEPEPFWNLTNGRRPPEPVPGLFASVCESIGHHVYDDVYGPRECARCGHRETNKAALKADILKTLFGSQGVFRR